MLVIAPEIAPGVPHFAQAVRTLAGRHHAVLLADHGPVVAGTGLEDAQYAAEELERTARHFLMLQVQAIRSLSPGQIAHPRARFDLP